MEDSGTSEVDETPELGQPEPQEDPATKRKKTRATFFLRMWMTFLMIGLFLGVLSLGHFAVVVEICIMQIFVFRELLNVRYNHAKERDIPWFRSVHWSLFFACTFYANGVPVLRFLVDKGLPFAHYLLQYHMLICFFAYAALLVAVVLSLKKHHYRYQMGQITWTALVLVIVVLQTRLIVYNIFSGLIWFFLPASLVTCNDCFAYFSGLAFGKRFFSSPFLALSPKKTWEGFIGAFLATVLFGFFWPLLLAQFPFLTCPYHNLSCVPDAMFTLQSYPLPEALASLQAVFFASPPVTQLWFAPIQFHSLCLATIASLIAPFGGFFASGIKRAYGIKDFDSVIPGHGGFMDRLDCQFVIGTYTFVHLTTFTASASGSVTAVVNAFAALPREAQGEALRRIVEAASVESVLPTTVLRALEAAFSA